MENHKVENHMTERTNDKNRFGCWGLLVSAASLGKDFSMKLLGDSFTNGCLMTLLRAAANTRKMTMSVAIQMEGRGGGAEKLWKLWLTRTQPKVIKMPSCIAASSLHSCQVWRFFLAPTNLKYEPSPVWFRLGKVVLKICWLATQSVQQETTSGNHNYDGHCCSGHRNLVPWCCWPSQLFWLLLTSHRLLVPIIDPIIVLWFRRLWSMSIKKHCPPKNELFISSTRTNSKKIPNFLQGPDPPRPHQKVGTKILDKC